MSLTVVGVARQNGHRPVNLLHQHDSNKLVRPSRGSEGEPCIGIFEQSGRKAVRPPDNEAQGLTAAIPPGANGSGKSFAGSVLAPAVQCDPDRAVRNGAGQCDCLLGQAALHLAGTTVPDLDNIGTAQAERSSDLGGAIAIALSEFAIGASFEATDRGDDNPHASVRDGNNVGASLQRTAPL